MTEAQAHIAAEAGAHGITGSFVGTTDTQTLTNKTITGGTVNPTTLQQAGVAAVTTTGTQTLTNKTLTSPAITDATITGTTTATSGTIALGTNASAITADSKTISAAEVGYLDGVTSAVQTQINTANTAITNNTPVGAVTMWVAADAPTGWTLCQGQAISRSTFGSLFTVIGTTYGAGDGSTTFNLPDLRGRVPMGAGLGRNVAGNADLATSRTLGQRVSDAQTVTLTAEQSGLPDHVHNMISENQGGANPATVAVGSGQTGIVGWEAGPGLATGFETSLNSTFQYAIGVGGVFGGAKNASSSHENTQPSTVINFIIKH
jgi:microcystin-dependent protein